MILIIRGHVRNSFDSDKLYNLLKDIYNKNNDLEIYIFTWSVFSTSLSWRGVEANSNQVTPDTIYAYFKDLKSIIKCIEIVDETIVKLTGNITGTVSKSPMPLKGWKFMLYSMFYFMDVLMKQNIDKETNIVITRFDLLVVPYNAISHKYLVDFIENNKNTTSPIVFTNQKYELHYGCDNIMIGSFKILYKLLYNLHFHLDDVLSRHPPCKHQEYYFIYEYLYLMKNQIN